MPPKRASIRAIRSKRCTSSGATVRISRFSRRRCFGRWGLTSSSWHSPSSKHMAVGIHVKPPVDGSYRTYEWESAGVLLRRDDVSRLDDRATARRLHVTAEHCGVPGRDPRLSPAPLDRHVLIFRNSGIIIPVYGQAGGLMSSMLRMSEATALGLHAVVCLAEATDLVTAQALAAALNGSVAHLSKVLQTPRLGGNRRGDARTAGAGFAWLSMPRTCVSWTSTRPWKGRSQPEGACLPSRSATGSPASWEA